MYISSSAKLYDAEITMNKSDAELNRLEKINGKIVSAQIDIWHAESLTRDLGCTGVGYFSRHADV